MPKFFDEHTNQFNVEANDFSLDTFNKADNKYEILSRFYQEDGCNALELALCNNLAAVPALLKAMESLDEQQKISILRQRLHNGRNALNLVADHDNDSSGIVPLFYETINSWNCSLETKYQLMMEILNKIFNPDYCGELLRHDQNLPKIIWEHDLKELLEELKPTQLDSPNYIINTNSPQSQLHRNLECSLDQYLKSSRTKADLKTFHTAWNNAINMARANEHFSKQPQIIDVLMTILLVLSILGNLYLVYQAGRNKGLNRSLFFPGKIEKQLNKLQDKALEVDSLPKNKEENSLKEVVHNEPKQDRPEPSAPWPENDPPPPYRAI